MEPAIIMEFIQNLTFLRRPKDRREATNQHTRVQQLQKPDIAVTNCQVFQYYPCRSSLLWPITKVREIIFAVQYCKDTINLKNGKYNSHKWMNALAICLHKYASGAWLINQFHYKTSFSAANWEKWLDAIYNISDVFNHN